MIEINLKLLEELKMEMDYIKRMEYEDQQLLEKISKLNKFLKTDEKRSKCTKGEILLMEEQLRVMEKYAIILEVRIKIAQAINLIK